MLAPRRFTRLPLTVMIPPGRVSILRTPKVTL
jgi:hypothetical protein